MSSQNQKSALHVAMGAMTFGEKGTEGARVHSPEEVEAILDVFQKHGHDVVDTARTYTGGTSEKFLGKLDCKKRGLQVVTKLYPFGAGNELDKGWATGVITHSPEDLRKHLDISLKALNVDSVDIWYLHGPDHTTDYALTLKGVNELYKEGKFKQFGISNYMAWEVVEIINICKENGYVQPTTYQGLYNVLNRNVEPELFPCLRRYGLSFYEFNPLAGGLLSNRYSSVDDVVEPGARFDPNTAMGQGYRARFWNEPHFAALATLRPVAEKHGLTVNEIALRWLSHHSLMKREYGDMVFLGVASLAHAKEDLADLEKGPLPAEVVKALDAAWEIVKPYADKYWH